MFHCCFSSLFPLFSLCIFLFPASVTLCLLEVSPLSPFLPSSFLLIFFIRVLRTLIPECSLCDHLHHCSFPEWSPQFFFLLLTGDIIAKMLNQSFKSVSAFLLLDVDINYCSWCPVFTCSKSSRKPLILTLLETLHSEDQWICSQCWKGDVIFFFFLAFPLLFLGLPLFQHFKVLYVPFRHKCASENQNRCIMERMEMKNSWNNAFKRMTGAKIIQRKITLTILIITYKYFGRFEGGLGEILTQDSSRKAVKQKMRMVWN